MGREWWQQNTQPTGGAAVCTSEGHEAEGGLAKHHGDSKSNAFVCLWISANRSQPFFYSMTSNSTKQTANWPAKCKSGGTTYNNAPNAHRPI